MALPLEAPGAAIQLLDQGKVVLLATDTLPGLHGRADRLEVLRRLAMAKGRPVDQPFLLLIGSVSKALALVGQVRRRARRLAADSWPGPFTFIFPAGTSPSSAFSHPGGTMALRVPDHPELLYLLEKVDYPVASTSANLAGEPPCVDWQEAVHRFQDRVDGILNPAPGLWTQSAGRASALVDLTVWPPRLLREGPRLLPRWAS